MPRRASAIWRSGSQAFPSSSVAAGDCARSRRAKSCRVRGRRRRSASSRIDSGSRAGISWRAYQEGTSGAVCPLTDLGDYVVHHDPFVFFNDITRANDAHAPSCVAHVRPYAELQASLNDDTAARYNFITPNVCDDMHTACAPLNDKVKQGDTWLSTELPKLLASQVYANNGAIFITWDEAKTGDGPIGINGLQPQAKGGGYQNTIHYNHSSTLRTIEEIFGVTPMLGDAANATDLSDLFVSFP